MNVLELTNKVRMEAEDVKPKSVIRKSEFSISL